MTRMIHNLLICVGVVLLLAGCSGSPEETKAPVNTLQVAELTEEQKEIVDLFRNDQQELQVYSYQTEEAFKSVDVWLEIYKDGELVEPRSGGITSLSDEPKALKGKIAVIISQNPDYQWTFSISQGMGKASSRSKESPHYLTSGRAFGPIGGVQQIKDGQEIVLHASIFSDSDGFSFSPQRFMDDPGIVKNYPYVHLIKAKFSK